MTTAVLRDATAKDPVLSRVLEYIQVGWPVDIPEELKSFRDKRGELAAEQGCLLWGIRVVIPASLQRKVLDEIHGGHLGVVKMKALARGHVWWSRIDQDIEFSTKNSDGCRQVKHDPKLTLRKPLGVSRRAVEEGTHRLCGNL